MILTQDDDEEEEESPIIKRRVRTDKAPDSTIGATTVTAETKYSKEEIDRLRQETENSSKASKESKQSKLSLESSEAVRAVRSVPSNESELPGPSEVPRPGQTVNEEFIDLNEYDAETIREEKSLARSVYDIEQGAGFEDESLAIGHQSEQLQEMAKKMDMARAIASVQSESDDEWEVDQIKKGYANDTDKYLAERERARERAIPTMAPLPTVTEQMQRLRLRLANLETQKDTQVSLIDDCRTELDRIEHRQQVVQESLDKASQGLEHALAAEAKRKSSRSTPVET